VDHAFEERGMKENGGWSEYDGGGVKTACVASSDVPVGPAEMTFHDQADALNEEVEEGTAIATLRRHRNDEFVGETRYDECQDQSRIDTDASGEWSDEERMDGVREGAIPGAAPELA
jgi:hypothetical protein